MPSISFGEKGVCLNEKIEKKIKKAGEISRSVEMGLLLGNSRIEGFQIQIAVAFAEDETEPIYTMICLAVGAVLIRVI